MTIDTDRLRALLAGPDVEWLVVRLRQRLERGVPLDGPIVLQRAAPAQRRAVERLLGRPAGRGEAVSVAPGALAAVLARAGIAPDLRTAVEVLTGPVADRREERAARDREWAAAERPLDAVARARPVLEPWRDRLRATGVLRRIAGGRAGPGAVLAGQAAGVIARLPAAGVPLAVLANAETGDAHALDARRPLAALVLGAAALLGDIPDGEGAEWRRTVWASVGVMDGELSGPVLALGLPGDADTATGRALACWHEAGQPVHLTARQLLRDTPRLDGLRGRRVHLCENPSVVAEAANRLGAACAPLVCTSTHPAAAATVLLRRLIAAGAGLRYHGDFDWPGITIANGIMARFGARPWRLGAADYRRAADAGGPALAGRAVTASWDPDLTPTMTELDVKVEEERVLDQLLSDLAG